MGILGPGISTWDLDILKDLAMVSALRGTDATGILQAKIERDKDGKALASEYFVEKSANAIDYFKWFHKYGKKGNRKVFEGTHYNLFAGHVRAATKGDLTDANAHPFDFPDTVGMHNGTLIEHRFHHKTKTDSELLIQEIDKNGIVPTLEKITNPYSAYALVIWHKDTGTVSFVRNKERPLFFCYSDTRNVMYWASEDWMLRGIMKRQRERIHKEAVYFLKEDVVYTIDPSKPMSKEVEKDFRTTKIKKDYGEGMRWTHGHGWHTPRVHFERQDLLPPPNHNSNNQSNILEFSQEKKDNKIPKFNCCACQKEMTLVDVHFATKFSNSTYVCEECQKEIPFTVNAMRERTEEVIIN